MTELPAPSGRACGMGSLDGRAVAQDPAHGDQARTPFVPVLAPLRVAPPVRPP